jgi:hypothetical protein
VRRKERRDREREKKREREWNGHTVKVFYNLARERMSKLGEFLRNKRFGDIRKYWEREKSL